MSSSKINYYYSVPEGRGGIYTMPIKETQPNTSGIGATFINKHAVGIYVPINDNECFCAHIFARISESDQDPKNGDSAQWVATTEQDPPLARIVQRQLERDLGTRLPTDKKKRKEKFNGAIVVFSDPRLLEKNAIGLHIIRAINHFFGCAPRTEFGCGFAKIHEKDSSEAFGEGIKRWYLVSCGLLVVPNSIRKHFA